MILSGSELTLSFSLTFKKVRCSHRRLTYMVNVLVVLEVCQCKCFTGLDDLNFIAFDDVGPLV